LTFFFVTFNPFVEIPFTIQLLVCLYLALFFTIFVGNFKPYVSRHKNRTEWYNESTIFHATFLLILFTDFVPDAEVQNDCGWVLIAVVLLNMLVNWGLFLVGSLGK
jgi:hypothetical protein